ncbi:hypothetical protein Pcinc_008834 [Petrolisthes cinctipes]|uniref:Uncharacterized protein n=1 Tax=Petrolisthes cinctipes TaxID=88211 RepID=A0AAE1KX51_PETCI|nr:hypothetical protein Pcinc_008827 [Petrolisthes cinctipes]KAK3887069.1 hypothetical protein Pcinc_008834 [Petrolisthes cinctipes]
MIRRLEPNITYTFLEIAWSGRRKRFCIKVKPNTTEARQFVDLCTGQRGSSFFNTRLTRVWNNCLIGGNYDYGVNRMMLPDISYEGRVMFRSHTDSSGEFIINTEGIIPKFGVDIGHVIKGLKVLQEVVQLCDTTQVTVVDCGVVVDF